MKKMRDQYHRRRDFIVRRFNEIGLKCHLPRGSFYAFPDVSGTGLGERDFAIGLLQAEKVAIVSGHAPLAPMARVFAARVLPPATSN